MKKSNFKNKALATTVIMALAVCLSGGVQAFAGNVCSCSCINTCNPRVQSSVWTETRLQFPSPGYSCSPDGCIGYFENTRIWTNGVVNRYIAHYYSASERLYMIDHLGIDR